jgi:hypothetical protein
MAAAAKAEFPILCGVTRDGAILIGLEAKHQHSVAFDAAPELLPSEPR